MCPALTGQRWRRPTGCWVGDATQRPTFASDNSIQELQANGVNVNANAPNQGTPLREELLLWFGPALLFGGLLAWWMRSGGAAGLGGLGGMGGLGPVPGQALRGHGDRGLPA